MQTLPRFGRLALAIVFFFGSTSFAHAQKTLVFKSTFEQYKPYSVEKIVSWKEANDEVGRIGGWRAYLQDAVKEAAQVEEIAPPPALSPKQPTNPHAEHRTK
jgi:hypothetical protein